MDNQHSALVQRALETLGYKDYGEYTSAMKAAHEAMANNPEFQEEIAFLRSGIPAGYTAVPHDTLVRMAKVIICHKNWRAAENIFQDLENQQQLEGYIDDLTPEDLQHIERLAKGGE